MPWSDRNSQYAEKLNIYSDSNVTQYSLPRK